MTYGWLIEQKAPNIVNPKHYCHVLHALYNANMCLDSAHIYPQIVASPEVPTPGAPVRGTTLLLFPSHLEVALVLETVELDSFRLAVVLAPSLRYVRPIVHALDMNGNALLGVPDA
jgi:hypothetical protein